MTRTYKIKIAIADEMPVVLSGLHAWFDAHERYRVTINAKNAAQLLTRLERLSCDLIVIDADSPEHAALLHALRARYPEAPVIAYTLETDPHALRAMQAAGAAGIASKRDDMRDLERVCDRVVSGATGVVSRRIAACLEVARAFGSGATYSVRVSVKPFDSAQP